MMTDGEVEVTLRRLLEEIQDTRRELKNSISASEARLLLEVQALRNKNGLLERENKDLKERLEKTERWCNKNNIVIFGLKIGSNITAEFLCREIYRLLGVRVELSEISDLYTLGNQEGSPVKVEFVSHRCKKLIFEHVKKLKGTEISITNDLTIQQRQENKRLLPFLIKARAGTSEKSYIRNNRLVVGRRVYTLEELENCEEDVKTNSAPNTPTITKHKNTATEIDSDTVVLESAPGPSVSNSDAVMLESVQGLLQQAKSNRDKKLFTPYLATHKKVYTNKKRSPPGEDVFGMKLRHKSTTDKK